MARDTPVVELASNDFLTHLKSLFPTNPESLSRDTGSSIVTSGNRNPWYIVAAVTFAACNRPQAIQILLEYVLKETGAEDSELEERLFRCEELSRGPIEVGLNYRLLQSELFYELRLKELTITILL